MDGNSRKTLEGILSDHDGFIIGKDELNKFHRTCGSFFTT